MADEDLNPNTEEPAAQPAGVPEDVTPIADQDEREYAPRPIDEEVKEASQEFKARPKTKDDFIAERLKKREAAHRRELAERDERIAAVERRLQEREGAEAKLGLEADLQRLSAKRETLQRKWIEATEQGRTEEVAQLNRDLNKVDFDILSTETVRDGRAALPPPPTNIAPRLDAWAKAVGYQGWSEEERQIAAGIDRALTRAGMKHTDDAYYAEMTRRLGAAIPERADIIAEHAPKPDDDEEDDEPQPAKKGKKVEPQPQTTRRLPGVASVANDARAPSGQDLPSQYHGNMRQLGLDDRDPAIRKAFRESMVRKGYL